MYVNYLHNADQQELESQTKKMDNAGQMSLLLQYGFSYSLPQKDVLCQLNVIDDMYMGFMYTKHLCMFYYYKQCTKSGKQTLSFVRL